MEKKIYVKDWTEGRGALVFCAAHQSGCKAVHRETRQMTAEIKYLVWPEEFVQYFTCLVGSLRQETVDLRSRMESALIHFF